MESLFKRVYEIIEANNNLFVTNGYQPIRTMDKFRGQTTQPEKFEIFETPALFIQRTTKWNREGKTYKGDSTIDFHLVIDEPADTANLFTNHEEALKQDFFYRVVQTILDDLEGEGFSKLQRVSDTPIDTGIFAYNVLTYSTTVYESSSNSTSMLLNDLVIEIRNKQLVKEIKGA